MKPFGQLDDPRRRILIQALTAGFFSTPWGAAAQSIFGAAPRKLPPGQSIYRASGRVRVNGEQATLATPIKAGDLIETGPGAELVFVHAEEAFILRGDSRLLIEKPPAQSLLKTALRLATGKLLSVFGRGRPTRIVTATATIGVRGTGVYAESDPEETYFCTCYGVADVTANYDKESKETVAATHHDRPLYIAAKGSAGNSIRRAPFINHTDQELMLIETLVGRTPPFVFPMDDYNAPRRDYP